MRKTVLAAAAAFVVASGATAFQAAAADLGYIPPPMAPAPVFVPAWQGFYIGGHVGYGEANFDGRASALFWDDYAAGDPDDDNDDDIFSSFKRSMTADGLIGGAQAGYNFQAGSMVFGIEGDISFADWGQSDVVFDIDDLDDFADIDEDRAIGTASVNVDMLASVRGRLGYAFDTVMIYGTGGVAWADATARGHIDVWDGDELVETISDKENFDDIGFVVGGGLGWMVIPQTFSVGVEGLYYFFDDKKTLADFTYDLNDDEHVDVHASASLDDAWVIRARADFHF